MKDSAPASNSPKGPPHPSCWTTDMHLRSGKSSVPLYLTHTNFTTSPASSPIACSLPPAQNNDCPALLRGATGRYPMRHMASSSFARPEWARGGGSDTMLGIVRNHLALRPRICTPTCIHSRNRAVSTLGVRPENRQVANGSSMVFTSRCLGMPVATCCCEGDRRVDCHWEGVAQGAVARDQPHWLGQADPFLSIGMGQRCGACPRCATRSRPARPRAGRTRSHT